MHAWLTLALLAAAPEVVSFDEAVKRALAQAPAIAIAELDAARSRAVLEQQRAPSLPTLGLNGSYTRLDSDRVLGDRVLASANQGNGNVSLGGSGRAG